MTGTAPKIRKDVARNRALLLSTADALIAERGISISLHDLAGAAGVGIGTVYRHFADRDALIDALIEQRFETARRVLLAAEEVADPVDSLRTAVLDVCELQQTDRAIWQALISDADRHRAIARERLKPIMERIVDRAAATGRVRADLAVTDVPVLFFLSGALNQLSGDIRPDLWRRYVSALLDGFMTRAGDRDPSGVAAFTEDELERTQPPR